MARLKNLCMNLFQKQYILLTLLFILANVLVSQSQEEVPSENEREPRFFGWPWRPGPWIPIPLPSPSQKPKPPTTTTITTTSPTTSTTRGPSTTAPNTTFLHPFNSTVAIAVYWSTPLTNLPTRIMSYLSFVSRELRRDGITNCDFPWSKIF